MNHPAGTFTEHSTMLFGLTLTKSLVVLTAAFFLFGVPLMALVMVAVERLRKETKDE